MYGCCPACAIGDIKPLVACVCIFLSLALRFRTGIYDGSIPLFAENSGHGPGFCTSHRDRLHHGRLCFPCRFAKLPPFASQIFTHSHVKQSDVLTDVDYLADYGLWIIKKWQDLTDIDCTALKGEHG